MLANASDRDEKGRPLCAVRTPRCTRLATTGDHIIPRILRPDLEYDLANGQPSCAPCNSSKGRRIQLLRPVIVVNGADFFDG